MSDFFYIANRKVGKSEIPLIIAELGINHGGCLKTAFKMVDSAASAGVEIVKHQTHIVEDEMSSKAKKVIPGNADISIYEMWINMLEQFLNGNEQCQATQENLLNFYRKSSQFISI